MGALMHAERKNEQDELEDGNNQVGLLQTRSPRAGKLRLAWRVEAIRAARNNARAGVAQGNRESE
jgi:hypothetical protein